MFRMPWLCFSAVVLLAGCNKNNDAANPSSSSGGATASTEKLDKLKIDDVKVGQGPGAKNGDELMMVYTGKLADGSVFDSNDKPDGKAFSLTLGGGQVIKGWDQGLVGMKEGGERKLSIPAVLGYGNNSPSKAIPAGSDLYFDVKLTHLLAQEDRDTIIRKTIKTGTGPALKAGDTAVINYTGKFFTGGPVDSKDDPKKPFSFVVGANKVWPGIDAGVVGMKKGGEISLQLPFQLGPHGPSLPPGSVTVYDIILRDIKHK
jgi:FKBP-type peptidyl-prolyl cis-trans isomerase